MTFPALSQTSSRFLTGKTMRTTFSLPTLFLTVDYSNVEITKKSYIFLSMGHTNVFFWVDLVRLYIEY